MTWSYDPAGLADSEKDRIRLEVADTVENQSVTLADEEIQSAIDAESGFWGAAARCAEMLSRRFLRMADVRIGRGGTSLTYSLAAKQYADMAATLRKKATGAHAPWAGGRSIADKESLASDPSLVQPLFTKRMGSNPFVGRETLGNTIDDGQRDA